jgi:hypothetical protein
LGAVISMVETGVRTRPEHDHQPEDRIGNELVCPVKDFVYSNRAGGEDLAASPFTPISSERASASPI